MTKDLVKIEQLTPEDLAEDYAVSSLSRTEKEIRYLKEKMTFVARASVVIAFELGRRLAAVKETLDHGQFLPWLEDNLDISERTAQNYMKLYARFREEPAAILENLTIQEAYVAAGVKKASSVNLLASDDEEEEGPLKFAGKRDLEAEKANMVALFRSPTVSGVKLKNHRVQNVGGRLWVYRKDVGTASPAMDLFLPWPPGLPESDWIEFQGYYAIATELYLSRVEHYEETGLIEAPEDLRMLSVVDRVEKKKAVVPFRKPEAAV